MSTIFDKKERTFKYGMRGISFIEKSLKKPINKVDFENLTMEEIAVVIQGGLVSDDKDITKKTTDEIMEIIDNEDNLEELLAAMSEAMREMQEKQTKKQQKAQK